MKTYVYKLYNSKRNRYLHEQITLYSKVYNHCIALQRRYYRLYGKYPHVYAIDKHLTKLKKQAKYADWRTLNAQAIQDIAERIDRAYKLFFKQLKAKTGDEKKVSPPGFRKSRNYMSFTLKQSGYKLLEGNRIKLGDREYKYFKHREIEGNIKTVTVRRDQLGSIYLSITTDYVEPILGVSGTGEMVGCDFGLKTFLTLSDGNCIESPLFFKRNTKAVKKANSQLSRKKRGSKNRRKAHKHLNRVHKRVANQRSNFHWQLANKLSDEYDYLFFEDLNIKGMQRLWGRKITDLGFYSFMLKLKYLAAKKGKIVHNIDRFEPSSKTCSVCGYLYKDLTLKEREWLCPECETLHDRDLNASYNILRVGASTLGVDNVRLSNKHLSLITESHD